MCAAAPQSVPASATVQQWRELPSGVPLTRIIAVNAANGRAYELLKNNYNRLREWANTQCWAP